MWFSINLGLINDKKNIENILDDFCLVWIIKLFEVLIYLLTLEVLAEELWIVYLVELFVYFWFVTDDLIDDH